MVKPMRYPFLPTLAVALALAAGLSGRANAGAAGCPSAGLALPPGFCATAFATHVGTPRHIAVAANGTVYANLGGDIDGHGLIALRDTTGDGTADQRRTFGAGGGTGLAIHDGWLYAATLTDIYRYRLDDALVPAGAPEHLVSGLPRQSQHSAHGLAIGNHDQLFVSIGAPSNTCQEQDRGRGSPGQARCPLLAMHGGIWRFSASTVGQQFTPNARYATGIRNMFAIAYDTDRDTLYGLQMGRDQLHDNWPGRFTSWQSAHLPAEQMFAISRGDDFGWPYCYYDPFKQEKLLNPEYGGDGSRIGPCSGYTKPIAAFPAHWAPMAIVFYTAHAFPARYRHGAFIAFHGSWNRAPYPQAGYRVVFQPLDGARVDEPYQPFAGPRGFTGEAIVRSPGAARHRPAGVAVGPAGALYISDDQGGTIYRVTYRGD